jgi:hypothetical protein
MPRIVPTLVSGLITLSVMAAQSEKSDKAVPRTVSVLLEQADGAQWKPADPHRVFRPDDEIRFRFRSNFSGYLYVLNETSAGQYLWLFPTQETGVDNRVIQDHEYLIPTTSGFFVIPPSPGYDTIFWILSPVSLAKIPDLPDKRIIDTSPEGHAPLLPRCQESTLRARNLCLDDLAGVGAVKETRRLPPALTPALPAPAQDLHIEEKSGVSHISSSLGGTAAFIYEFRVAHQ